MALFRRSASLLVPYWPLFVLSIAGFSLYASGQPAMAWILKGFVDGINNPEQAFVLGMPMLYGFPLILILVTVYQGVGSFIGSYTLTRVSQMIGHGLRKQLFQHLLALPEEYFDSHKKGHIHTRVTANVGTVVSSVTESLQILFRDGLTVIALLAFLMWQDWRLTLALFLAAPPLLLLSRFGAKRFRAVSRDIQKAMGNVTQVLTEVVGAHRTVRSFDASEQEYQRFRRTLKENMARQLRLVKMGAVFTPIVQLITAVALAGVMFLVLYFRTDATAGDLIAYITAAALLPKPMRHLSELSVNLQRGLAAAENVFGFFNVATEGEGGPHRVERVAGSIRVENLDFAYATSSSPVLQGVSFEIPPGQTCALVGRSGSGKSTLAALLPRYYSCAEGQIFIDGIDINQYKLKDLRRQIAVVSQEVQLFNDTIHNNIAYGELAGATPEAVAAAAQAAHIAEFIESLEHGYQTIIGAHGTQLSGGQRQRIAIARAFLKDAPILILDEATSALDNTTESAIQQALGELREGRTTMVISHRLSSVMDAQQILVLDDGRIVERGTHEQLLRANGAYATLFQRESAEGEALL